MKLNRHNYEEYFILYLDNELNNEDRHEVEMFTRENPDLKAELDMLLQTRLTADTTITFPDKETLLARNSASVNLNNYEEWLLSYIDNELTEQEVKDVEKFIASHPAAKKELELFQKTKLQPELIAFPGKESLYRKEEKAKVVAIRWWRIAAAAVLLIGISTTVVVLLNNDKKTGESLAGRTKIEKSTDNNSIKPPVNETPANEQAIAKTGLQKDESTQKVPRTLIAGSKDKIKKEKDILKPVQKGQEQTIVAKTDPDKKPDNNLPKPDHNPRVIVTPDLKNDGIIASTNQPKAGLTDPENKTGIAAVTPKPSDTYIIKENGSGETTKDPDAGFASNDGSKNKYRGFFRKITRTFEKRTNIKATDEEDSRLLIAGLAIKLN